jgi:hypothetical protein
MGASQHSVQWTLGILARFSSSFLRLGIFRLDGVPSSAPAPVTQTVGRSLSGSNTARIEKMDDQTILNSDRSRLPLWIGIILIILCGICLLVLTQLAGAILASQGPKELHIGADEIPIYPNAKMLSIAQDEPAENNIRSVSTWKFTTSDTPQMVWKFYVDEMGSRWGFYEWPLTESPLHLTVVSCPTNNLYMTSSLIDNITYQVTIQFMIGYCY